MSFPVAASVDIVSNGPVHADPGHVVLPELTGAQPAGLAARARHVPLHLRGRRGVPACALRYIVGALLFSSK